LVQLPRPYSFQKISWPPLDHLLWRRSGRFCQEFARVENSMEKRFTVCTEITIILGPVRFTMRGGRLRYKRYDAHFLKKVVLNFRFLLLVSSRDVTIHFFHKRYASRYLICITIRIAIFDVYYDTFYRKL
jgi:hypothetical protein